MLNSMCICKVGNYSNGNPDKNGLDPIFLSLVAGTMPNRMVIAGTVAEREGLVVGTTVLAHFVERAPSEEYGRQFAVAKLSDLSGLEIIAASKELGKAIMVNVDLPESVQVPDEVAEMVEEH